MDTLSIVNIICTDSPDESVVGNMAHCLRKRSHPYTHRLPYQIRVEGFHIESPLYTHHYL